MSTHGLIKAIFEDVCGHLKADAKLARKISEFQVWFVNKNEDHMAFFGGNLTGVQVVRFMPQDKDKFFVDVLEVDEYQLEDALHSSPAINKSFKVSSDPFNQMCMYLLHIFLNSTTLNEKARERVLLDIGLILFYRFLTSLMYNFFKFPADPQIAAMTYAQLSEKFLLKKLGSWQATLEDRSIKMIEEGTNRRKTVKEFTNDAAIVALINDSQGRIRDMMKNIYGEFMRVHSSGSRIHTTSMISDHDGELIMKDATKSLVVYSRYMRTVLPDENGFIKDEILTVLSKFVHTASRTLLEQSLRWMSTNYKYASLKEIEELVDKTLLHSFAYLQNHRTVFRETQDLSGFIVKLKGVYMSSKSTDPELIEIRDMAEAVVRKATTTKNASAIASVRTALLLYIVIRAFTMTHYSGTQ